MRRHHCYNFEFESDELGEITGSIRTIAVLVDIEFDLETGQMYDSPFGPLGQGSAVENVTVVDIYTEHGISVKDFYDRYPDFKIEVDRAVKQVEDAMIRDTLAEAMN